MCVSGLPILNGINHAGEIASMGLALLRAIQVFVRVWSLSFNKYKSHFMYESSRIWFSLREVLCKFYWIKKIDPKNLQLLHLRNVRLTTWFIADHLELPHTSPTEWSSKSTHRNPLWSMRCWCGRHQDAQILSFRGYCKHCEPDAEQWHTWVEQGWWKPEYDSWDASTTMNASF